MNGIWLWVLLAVNCMTVVLLLAVLLQRSARNKDIETLEKMLDRTERLLKEEISYNREEMAAASRALRGEVHSTLNTLNESLLKRMEGFSQLQATQHESFVSRLEGMTRLNGERLEQVRTAVETRLKSLQADNNKQLEQMRNTVDEKLHATLEQRLGESFRLVSERLELVQRGLGEMQALATGVGDLKRVLTNVKTRGVWGEYQLGNLMEQILTIDQYAVNVATKPGSRDRVEFAVKLPGKDKEGMVWLPIDAKFPQEDYQRLLDAQEQANPVLAEESAKALELRLKAEAKAIADKYISPPNTTDFGVLFLPVEGLYAEALRRPGLYDTLLRDYRIVLSGPTTLAAFLNSLQMGFRTLAVEKRSSEVWSLLGAVKTEFGKFGDLLDKTRSKLEDAGKSIDTALTKSRTIERKLRKVQEIPAADAQALIAEAEQEGSDE